MSAPGEERVEEIRARVDRHGDVLDTGGTELALVGDDIRWLLARLRAVEGKYHEAMEILTRWENIDGADAVAKLAHAEQRVAELEKAVRWAMTRVDQDSWDYLNGMLTPPPPEQEEQ